MLVQFVMVRKKNIYALFKYILLYIYKYIYTIIIYWYLQILLLLLLFLDFNYYVSRVFRWYRQMYTIFECI